MTGGTDIGDCRRQGCGKCLIDVPWTKRKENRAFIEALIRWHR